MSDAGHLALAMMRNVSMGIALHGYPEGIWVFPLDSEHPTRVGEPSLLCGLTEMEDERVISFLRKSPYWQVVRWENGAVCVVALIERGDKGCWKVYSSDCVGCLVGEVVGVGDVALLAYLEAVDVLDHIKRGRVTENVE